MAEVKRLRTGSEALLADLSDPNYRASASLPVIEYRLRALLAETGQPGEGHEHHFGYTDVRERTVCRCGALDPREDPAPVVPDSAGWAVGAVAAEYGITRAEALTAALRSPEVVAGIAGVLREHGSGYWTDPRGWEWAACSGCEWNRDLDDDGLLSRSEGARPHADHQARAVVEWLTGGAR